MRFLLVGGDGFVGRALRQECDERKLEHSWTTRRPETNGIRYDLAMNEELYAARDADVVFIIAALASFRAAEKDALAWRVNADAPVRIAAQSPGHVVLLSSDCIIWSGDSALARQKRYAELGVIAAAKSWCIVRPSKLDVINIRSFCSMLVNIAEMKRTGFAWFTS